MIIYKIANQDPFTKVPTQAMRNKTLSLKAKGLLAYLLSHADKYEITEKQLIEASSDGRSAVQTALKELEKHGYIEREQLREENGRLGKLLLKIHSTPVPVAAGTDSASDSRKKTAKCSNSQKPPAEKPPAEKPQAEKPQAENLPAEPYIQEDQKKNTYKDLNRAPRSSTRAGAGAIYISKIFEDGGSSQQDEEKQQEIQRGNRANEQRDPGKDRDKNIPATETPSFPLTQDEEDEFYRLAIAYKLTNDKRLDLGNAAAIISAAISRLKKGCSRPDDRLLLTLYQEGLLAQNSGARNIQSKMRQKEMMDALSGL